MANRPAVDGDFGRRGNDSDRDQSWQLRDERLLLDRMRGSVWTDVSGSLFCIHSVVCTCPR